MTLLITGASGFIGGAILRQLIESQYDLHAISRQVIPAEDGVTWHQVDLFDQHAIDVLLNHLQPTHLLHLAWNVEPRVYWTSLDNFRWVGASLYLLNSFQRNGGTRAVLAGTCAEYDWRYGYCVEGVTPLQTQGPYQQCKVSLYQLASAFAEQSEISLAWGRVFFSYGVGENLKKLIPSVIQGLLQGDMVETTHAEQVRDYIYIEDVASAFVQLLNSDVEGAVNIASGNPTRLKDLILMIGELIGRPDLLKIGAKPSPDEAPFVVGDAGRLRETVGFIPQISVRQGIGLSIQWWKRQLA